MPSQYDDQQTQGRKFGLPGFTALVAGLAIVLTWGSFAGIGPSIAAAQTRTEPLLPRFEGPRIDAPGHASTDLLRNRRALVYVFGSADRDADRVAKLLAGLSEEAIAANVTLLGVTRDSDPMMARLFAKSHGFEFPIIVDVGANVSRKLGLQPGNSSLLIVDPEGYIVGGFTGMQETDPRIVEYYDNQIREALFLPQRGDSVAPTLGVLPQAPAFQVRRMDGEMLSSADLKNKVVVLTFFLPTCPHCHEMLKFLKTLLKRVDHEDLVLVPISISPKKYVIEDMAKEFGIEYALYTDPGDKVQKDYAHRHSVPDTLVINREGRIVGRRTGSQPRQQAQIMMEVRGALGIDNPILLDRTGYSGADTCLACHSSQHETWSLTNHAYAFETLAEHAEDRNPECLPCHTVGWDKKGGYSLEKRPDHLRGVQCENCHGRGGPHQSPDFIKDDFQEVCEGCHTQEHSLRFIFAERLPLVSHEENLQFASLSLEERQKLITRRDQRTRALFDKGEFVGSASCQECHASEHEIWSKSGHARAFDTLRGKSEHANADCQKCHTTGFGETGGWPTGGDAQAEVGCESCHGPGGQHVQEGSVKTGSILGLTDKCDSCVIMQICGSCHDDANDPRFEFELDDKIDRIRHGFRDKTASK
ncbi:MAG: redoxin domain-containing protein [bacterium]|nr:redoxin domain-containing protein [bacterium]